MSEIEMITYSIVTLFATVILMMSVVYGIDKTERVECLTWQGYAATISGFYLTPDQKDQCERWQISVTAPVHE